MREFIVRYETTVNDKMKSLIVYEKENIFDDNLTVINQKYGEDATKLYEDLTNGRINKL